MGRRVRARGLQDPVGRVPSRGDDHEKEKASPWLLGFGLIAIALISGCGKSDPPAPHSLQSPKPIEAKSGQVGESIARVHWLGKQRIAGETNSSALMAIWNMPESVKVEARFLDQLSLAPWRMLPGNTNYSVTNAASALLRPLLEDLVQNECFLEISHATNQPVDIALAIHLDEVRGALWKSKLPAVWQSLSVPSNQHLEVSRSGEWTLVGLGREQNPVVKSLSDHVRLETGSGAGAKGSLWLEGTLDLEKINAAFSLGLKLPLGLPRLQFAEVGNPQGISTKGILDFAYPLPFSVEPWNIPTNLIHGALHSFTALQGVGPFLSSLKAWKDLGVGPAPNQIFTWGLVPYQAFTYLAAPVANASNIVSKLSEALLEKGNSWLKVEGSGQFVPSPVSDGVDCTSARPLMGSFLQSASAEPGDFILAGWGRNDQTNQPPPVWLISELYARTNALLYEREMTGARLGAWLYLGQATRIVFWKAQLPPDSAGALWLHAAETRLGGCVTSITRTGVNQLTFDRNSSVGLNSIELHLLADWIESPQFPRSLHTLAAKGIIRPGSFRKTNAAPASVTNTNK